MSRGQTSIERGCGGECVGLPTGRTAAAAEQKEEGEEREEGGGAGEGGLDAHWASLQPNDGWDGPAQASPPNKIRKNLEIFRLFASSVGRRGDERDYALAGRPNHIRISSDRQAATWQSS